MAIFGDLIGFGNNNTTSIPASFQITSLGLVVEVGDLVVVAVSENPGATTSAVNDNLSNTYTALQTIQTSGNISGVGYYARVTTGGTLNTVTATCTSSSNNAAIVMAAFKGPFVVSPLDRNPANETTDLVTPHNCPSTSVLSQAIEVVVNWAAGEKPAGACLNSMGTGTYIDRGQDVGVTVSMGYTVTASTSSVANTFTSSNNPVTIITATASFKADSFQPYIKRTGGVPFMSASRRGVW